MNIIKHNNPVDKFRDRLLDAWEYAYGDHKQFVDKDDIRAITFLDPTRTQLYSLDEQGNPTDLCVVKYADSEDGFGVGKLLIMPQRTIGFDLRDRNPSFIFPQNGSLKGRAICDFDTLTMSLGDPDVNIWDRYEETDECKLALKKVLEEFPNPNRKKKTTVTTTA